MNHPHPAASCTPAQIAAFERICVGDDSMIRTSIGKALALKGLVTVRAQATSLGGLPFAALRYDVPVAHHYAWCCWCAEQFELIGDTERAF